MIIPLTFPPKTDAGPALPSALARLGSSEFFLLELQGELEVSGDKHGQLVGRLTIDDATDGKVRISFKPITLHAVPHRSFLTYVPGQTDTANRPSPLRGQDRQFAQATGDIEAHMCCATTTTTINKLISKNARREW